ncbi:26S proteasome regulatory subunit 6A-B-like [Anopheles funestus]|uniref:26S proteasome regulatory subunit 6A-B-like n=1 Tax=Anopheles funestus TaxID=62324 RepID=UPI0020C6831E|nr:26S proteasome regulatory subunit 6A-B-like [Anopheles funestus]
MAENLAAVESNVENIDIPEYDEIVSTLSTEELISLSHQMDQEIVSMKQEIVKGVQRSLQLNDMITKNNEFIKRSSKLPYLVANVMEVLDMDPLEDEKEQVDGMVMQDSQRKCKSAVIKTSTRHICYLPLAGLVDADKLTPGDMVAVHRDTYLMMDVLPKEHDPRVQAMEVIDRPTEQYTDIGGLDNQIKELIEAIVLPLTHSDKFARLGIRPPKGVLMYGPPGTGKTLLARACAAQTRATFIKLAGPQLVQKFIGDGAKLVRDAFALAKEKSPTIIFIDELDAIGTKRFDSTRSGDREVQRTMLELLNQLDGFGSTDNIKVIGATNRIDILDPALLRSGRIDRKIEFPHPTDEARARIMQIHSRRMNLSADVNFEELARCTDNFNGAQCKAVCVEAGMIAISRSAVEVRHEDFMEAIIEVQAKKKVNLNYFT